MRPNSLTTLCLGLSSATISNSAASAQDNCLPTWGSVSYLGITNDLITFDAGFGEQLYATRGGRLSRWDGATWTQAGTAVGSNGGIFQMRRVQTDAGARLWSLGRTGIWESNGDTLTRIAQLNGTIFDVIQADIGSGLQTFASSDTRVFRLDQGTWAQVAQFPYYSCINSCLAVYDDGSGPAVYVAGSFDQINGQLAARIARLNDGSWTEVGGGLNDGYMCGRHAQVMTMVTYDDGSGPKLYAGGAFSSAGGVPVGGLACWDGTSWAPVGGANEPGNIVNGLRILDFGNGPKLVVIGEFSQIGGVPARNIATWDGSSWEQIAGGIATDHLFGVWCAATYDDGSAAGPSLFVGGDFGNVNGATILGVTRLDCVCPDLTGDGTVGLDDMAVVLGAFGQSGSSAGDLNHDGAVSIADLSILLARFGTTCE